jgi:hypothetical protein
MLISEFIAKFSAHNLSDQLFHEAHVTHCHSMQIQLR